MENAMVLHNKYELFHLVKNFDSSHVDGLNVFDFVALLKLWQLNFAFEEGVIH